MLKKILLGALGVVAVLAAGAGIFAFVQISAFDDSISKVYEVPLPAVTVPTDAVALERGKHLAESIGGCTGCHGPALSGGKLEEMGPLGRFQMGNITGGKNGALSAYSDAELARLIKHGIRKDGTSARFMPSSDFAWWPDEDVAALIAYLRTVPKVDTDPPVVEIGPVGKILDRMDMMPLDVARRIDHSNLPKAPPPSESAEYGAYLARLCHGCHGAKLSGGKMPGTPPSFPIPANLTPHATGLQDWTFADFDKLMRQGIKKNGARLDPFMPVDTMKNFNETEMKALWAYLRTIPALELGNR